MKCWGIHKANKKDASSITGGGHTMSTTKKGKLLNHEKPSLGKTKVTIWSVGGELGRLSVEYHMGHTLQVNLSLSWRNVMAIFSLVIYACPRTQFPLNSEEILI